MDPDILAALTMPTLMAVLVSGVAAGVVICLEYVAADLTPTTPKETK